MKIKKRQSIKNIKACKSKKKSESRLLFEYLEPRCMLDAGPLLISEFVAKNTYGIVDDYGNHSDWIEIRNPTQNDINLNGWSLTDNPANLSQCRFPSIVLPQGGYLLVFASSQAIGSTFITGPGGKLHANFNLNKDGEYLALVQSDGITIASQFAPTFPPQTSDVSYGLSNDLTTTGFFTVPTPGSANTNNPVADLNRQVVINEIMYRPGFGDWGETGYIAENPKEEFIELYNRGLSSVDISGWKLTQGVDYTLPAGTTIAAGGYLAVVADTATFHAKYPTVTNYVGGWIQSRPDADESLANNGEKIELSDALGNRIDAVTYASEGDWALRRVGEQYPGQPTWWSGWHIHHRCRCGNKSLELINSALSNDESGKIGRPASPTAARLARRTATHCSRRTSHR